MMGTQRIESFDPNQPTLQVVAAPGRGTPSPATQPAVVIDQNAVSGTGAALLVRSSNPNVPALKVSGGISLDGGTQRLVISSPGAPDISELPVGRAGSATDGLYLIGSFAGGEDRGQAGQYDSTARIYSYHWQNAQTLSAGEWARHFAMRRDAKMMEAGYVPVTNDGTLLINYDATTRLAATTNVKWAPAWWQGGHVESNAHNGDHVHWELEVPDSAGALQGRIVVPFANPTTGAFGLDKTNVGFNQADLTMYASAGVIRVAGSNQYNKDIEGSLDINGGAEYRRWKIRIADATTETGSNAGSDFGIFRYDDTGTIVTPAALKILRSNGNVGVGITTPAARLDVVAGSTTAVNVTQSNDAVGVYVTNTKSGGNANQPAFRADLPASTNLVLSSRVTGDGASRFVQLADGAMQWGDGTNSRDTVLQRLGANLLGTASGDKFVAAGGLGVGNSASATAVGTLSKKMEVFDTSGNSLGFVPIYTSIT